MNHTEDREIAEGASSAEPTEKEASRRAAIRKLGTLAAAAPMLTLLFENKAAAY